jgi:hypothetical protein
MTPKEAPPVVPVAEIVLRPADLHRLRRYRPVGLTCARTGTARGPACLAGLGWACACAGWTT